jgi:hypothetical protein
LAAAAGAPGHPGGALALPGDALASRCCLTASKSASPPPVARCKSAPDVAGGLAGCSASARGGRILSRLRLACGREAE